MHVRGRLERRGVFWGALWHLGSSLRRLECIWEHFRDVLVEFARRLGHSGPRSESLGCTLGRYRADVFTIARESAAANEHGLFVHFGCVLRACWCVLGYTVTKIENYGAG